MSVTARELAMEYLEQQANEANAPSMGFEPGGPSATDRWLLVACEEEEGLTVEQVLAEAYRLEHEENEPDEPDIDDSVKCCPDCERPNQFGEICQSCLRERGEDECDGHPAGPFDPMGETVYCDGSCKRRS